MGLITAVTGQLLNEIIENEGWVGTNTDPIADFYKTTIYQLAEWRNQNLWSQRYSGVAA
jgi:hypothetical protein